MEEERSTNSQVIRKKLAEANASVKKELLFLKHVAEEQPENYKNFIENCSKILAEKIEPESQTHMLDSMMSMEGVLLAGVLGAGGFDAIFAITFGSISRDHVAHHWKTNCVLPLPVIEDPRGFTLEEGDPRERN